MTEIADIIGPRQLEMPWVLMWTLAVVIYFSAKVALWWPHRRSGSLLRQLGFLFASPGTDAGSFFDSPPPPPPATREWLAAVLKACLGAAFIWLLARKTWPSHAMIAGWTGMIGLALLLHFGLFHLITLAWQANGVDAKPLMQKPMKSRSLADLWGRRWNTGFNAIARELLFEPLAPRFGAVAATIVVFLASGLIHDIVISIPARGGYGLPTLYFLIQFAGLLLERTPALRPIRRDRLLGWIYTVIVALVPAPLLFHPPFVRRVILPFLHAIGALP